MGRLGAAYDARRVVQGGAGRGLLRPSGKAKTMARRSAQLVRFADSKSAAMLADPVRPSEEQS